MFFPKFKNDSLNTEKWNTFQRFSLKSFTLPNFIVFDITFWLFHITMFFDLLSTRLSTLEAQKWLHDKQPEAGLKKGCAYKKKRLMEVAT